jgi:hypothetical protein
MDMVIKGCAQAQGNSSWQKTRAQTARCKSNDRRKRKAWLRKAFARRPVKRMPAYVTYQCRGQFAKSTVVLFLGSLVAFVLSLGFALAYFFMGTENIGYVGVSLLVIGLCGLYASLERAENDQSSFLGRPST